MLRKILKTRLARGDEGIALVLVISIGLVLSILVIAGIAYAVGGIKYARTTQDTDASLAAAYAGIEEYQSRLAADPGYWRYGNPAADFTLSSGSSVSAPGAANPAFGSGVSQPWATVPGSSTSSPARFRYEVDNSKYAGSGVIRVRATGLVGTTTRTLVADLKQQGFLDFLYFTDYEIRDPIDSSLSCSAAYEWAVASRPNCETLQFARADTLEGPVHSNDTLLICNSTFNGAVTTGNPDSPFYNSVAGCSAPRFNGGPAKKSAVIGMPSTNSELKRETRTDVPEVAKVGCLYTGPTTIQFLSNGRMTVRSPWTKLTNTTGDPASGGSVPAACGTPGAGGLGSAGGQTVSVPSNSVIYVQNIPAAAGVPNSATSAQTGSGVTCKSPGGTAVAGNGLGFPATNEEPPSTSTTNPSYGCRNGDVFVKGTLSGQVTVGAENYVYVTGDLKYNDPRDDMMGLISQNAIYVWNPVTASDTTVLGNTNRRIDAAILSVAHSFQVQNFRVGGARGTLTLNGAIAQVYRGAVATTRGNTLTSGYLKNYLYDKRFQFAAPPKFLSPVTTSYGVSVWIETERAYESNGGVL